MSWQSFKERVTPEVSRQLEEEAERFNDLSIRLGLAFRGAQEEAFEAYAAWEEQVETGESLIEQEANAAQTVSQTPTERQRSETRQPSRVRGFFRSRRSEESGPLVSTRTPTRPSRIRRWTASVLGVVGFIFLVLVGPVAYARSPMGQRQIWYAARALHFIRQAGDFMLVLDRSGSIDNSKLTDLKTAVNDFVAALAPSKDGNHVGQVSFATNPTLDQPLTDNVSCLTKAIDGITSGAGLTNLEEGITSALAELNSAHSRPNWFRPNVMIIVTDGQPTRFAGDTCNLKLDPESAATAAAAAANAAGTEIFVVGVGIADSPTVQAYLRDNIATDASHYADAKDYAEVSAKLRLVASRAPS